MVLDTTKLLHTEKKKNKLMGIRRVAGLARNLRLMRAGSSTGKATF